MGRGPSRRQMTLRALSEQEADGTGCGDAAEKDGTCRQMAPCGRQSGEESVVAKFRYRMQNVLNIKISMERQAKQQYAEANRKLREEEEKLNALIRRKFGYETTAKKLLADRLNVRDIMENNQAIVRMDEYIGVQRAQVQLAQKNLERARMRMTEVMQERKTHERLREKAFDVFVQEEKQKESKEIDQLVSYTYGQRLKETEYGKGT